MLVSPRDPSELPACDRASERLSVILRAFTLFSSVTGSDLGVVFPDRSFAFDNVLERFADDKDDAVLVIEPLRFDIRDPFGVVGELED